MRFSENTYSSSVPGASLVSDMFQLLMVSIHLIEKAIPTLSPAWSCVSLRYHRGRARRRGRVVKINYPQHNQDESPSRLKHRRIV